jgi:hypothetical protein
VVHDLEGGLKCGRVDFLILARDVEGRDPERLQLVFGEVGLPGKEPVN